MEMVMVVKVMDYEQRLGQPNQCHNCKIETNADDFKWCDKYWWCWRWIAFCRVRRICPLLLTNKTRTSLSLIARRWAFVVVVLSFCCCWCWLYLWGQLFFLFSVLEHGLWELQEDLLLLLEMLPGTHMLLKMEGMLASRYMNCISRIQGMLDFINNLCKSLGVINPTGNFHFVWASVP